MTSVADRRGGGGGGVDRRRPSWPGPGVARAVCGRSAESNLPGCTGVSTVAERESQREARVRHVSRRAAGESFYFSLRPLSYTLISAVQVDARVLRLPHLSPPPVPLRLI